MSDLAIVVVLGVFASIFLAGTVKGSLGIGFPAVSMSLLPMLIEPALAVTILALPIVVTNTQQFFSSKSWRSIARQFLLGGATLFLTVFLVIQFVSDVPTRWINTFIGLSLTAFALAGLFKISLKATDSARWQLAVGISAGVLGGISAVKSPVMVYSIALDLPRDAFMGTAGFLFLCGGLGMVGGLTTAGLLDSATLPLSLGAVAAGICGFWLGDNLSRRLPAALFRKILLWAMLLLGLRLILFNLVL